MNISTVSLGENFPEEFKAVIEISANAPPIKFEIDEESGLLAVDRFIGTSMVYPTNYGFVPNTLSGDGDPCDVLLITPFPIPPSILVRCRAIGMLDMEDDGGLDRKIVAVPTVKLCPMYKKINQLSDLPELLVQQIQHFFEHYKDLEPGKWVKIKGWADVKAAKQELEEGVRKFKNNSTEFEYQNTGFDF